MQLTPSHFQLTYYSKINILQLTCGYDIRYIPYINMTEDVTYREGYPDIQF